MCKLTISAIADMDIEALVFLNYPTRYINTILVAKREQELFGSSSFLWHGYLGISVSTNKYNPGDL